MTQTCPQCGAETSAGTTCPRRACREIFDRCLALEFEQPGAFDAVHHLTVLCYMLPHTAYTRDA